MMREITFILGRAALGGLLTLTLLGPATSTAGASERANARWHTEKTPVTAMSIAVPPGAFVKHGSLVPRHRGFDIVQVASFEIEDGHHVGFGVPEGEWVVHYAYEANSFDPAGELRDFVDEKLVSVLYRPTGDEPVVGGRRFIELGGEMGTIWVTHQGWNVYSFMIYGDLDQAPRQLIEKMLTGWQLEQNEPIHIAPEDHGEWAGGLPDEEPTLAQRLPGQPYMKMPWANTASYRYTGGPHHPSYTGNGCSNKYSINDMSGLDFGLPNNTEVLAVAPGTVRAAGASGDGRGTWVQVEHVGYGIASEYWHLSSKSVSVGNTVARGKVLGKSGNTSTPGANLDPHLHFELRYYPGRARYTMHALSIDGYLVYALHPNGTFTQGFNYQGTLIKGSSSWSDHWHCSQWARKWSGSTQTISAGDSTTVSSTNVRIP